MDERTGEIHDYTRKGGVEFSGIAMPAGATWEPTRAELWNAAELAEKRKDACVAREHEIALPKELTAEQRTELAQQYAQDLADRHKCAVDVAIHAPHQDKGGEANDNYHAHLLCTTREVDGQGLGQKCQREKAGQNRAADLELERSTWSNFQNAALEQHGHQERVDHRSLKDQGIDREPTSHKGPAVTEMERRGIQTEVSKRLEAAKSAGEFERNLGRAIDAQILSTETKLNAALTERKDHEQRAKQQFFTHEVPHPNQARTELRDGLLDLSQCGLAHIAPGKGWREAESAHVLQDHARDHLGRSDGLRRDAGAGRGVEPQIGANKEAIDALRAASLSNSTQEAQKRSQEPPSPSVAPSKTSMRLDELLAQLDARKEPRPEPTPKEAQKPAAEPYFANNIAGREARYKWEQAQKAAAKVAAIEAKVKATDLTPEQQAVVLARVQENAAKSAPSNQTTAPAVEPGLRISEHELDILTKTDAVIQSGDMTDFGKVRETIWRQRHELEKHLDKLTFNEKAEREELSDSVHSRAIKAVNAQYSDNPPFGHIPNERSSSSSNLWEYHHRQAVRAVNDHRETPRPLMFGKAEWDKKDDQLMARVNSWATALKRLPGEVEGHRERITQEDEKNLARRAAEAVKNAPDRINTQGRLDLMNKAEKRLEDAFMQQIEKQQRIEQAKRRDQDQGMSR